MDETGDFFSEALSTGRDMLADLVVHAGLQLRPGVLSRGMARQCRIRLTFLMNYFRQLIFLLAAGMIDALPPVESRAGAVRREPAEGVEDVTASFLAVSGPRPWRLALAPGHYAPVPGMPEILGRPLPNEVPAGRFIEKVIALGAILLDPAPHARRIARDGWRKATRRSSVYA